MRAVVQRVSSAAVTVEGQETGSIGRGLVVFLGVGRDDAKADADYLAEKVVGLRIFEDEAGKMNLSVQDAGGSVLIVSQFTLFGDCRKGRRPSFVDAAPPADAEAMYEYFVETVRSKGVETATGRFRARMAVRVNNDGPVTILLDSKRRF